MNAPEFPPPLAAPSPLSTLDALPFAEGFAALPEAFYTRLDPLPLPAPYLVAASPPVAELIGLDPGEIGRAEFAEHFSGNRPLPGSAPLAAIYSGHQFGVWAGQLGDGRAHLLGAVVGGRGQWEIQLKGAGRTPYSRGADGRAVLRSSIREFLCSEAMAGLGIPTTRALCVVGSDAPVVREEVETAAVVTRIAESFVRFGSFEHWAARNRPEELRRLADYVIDTFRPDCRAAANPYDALLRDVSRRTGDLMARWMAVGFMHGVMNTDNMSILGLTLDYGPFGFMEAFDAGHICNHSDPHGRYSYQNQPQIAYWNLFRLADAFVPLLGQAEIAQAAVEETYVDAFESRFHALLRAKLGLLEAAPGDPEFFAETIGLLHHQRLDFTQFFRALSHLPAIAGDAGADAPLRDQFIDRAAGDAWLAAWRVRLTLSPWPDTERQASMRAANPKYVLRNWLAEQAIRRARAKDFSEVERLLACLARPFDEQPENQAYAAPPPDWAARLEVSCSS